MSEASTAPTYTLAIRRNPGVPAAWRLRFEVSGGAFILRTRRAGVEVDGPPLAGGAVDVGQDEVLDSLRLRLVDYTGARVASFRISRSLNTIPGSWAPLHEQSTDDDGTLVLLPEGNDVHPAEATSTNAQLDAERDQSATPAGIVKQLRRDLARARHRSQDLAQQVATLESRIAELEEDANTLIPSTL